MLLFLSRTIDPGRPGTRAETGMHRATCHVTAAATEPRSKFVVVH